MGSDSPHSGTGSLACFVFSDRGYIVTMRSPSQQSDDPPVDSLRSRLGLNRSTGALLAAILLIGMGQELWAPFMPKFIQESIRGLLESRQTALGLSESAVVVLAVGLFGFWKDLQEAVYYYLGGRIGGSLGTRRALIAFSILPLTGYAMLLLAVTPGLATIMAFASLPFISAYDSISQPATLTVVGQTLEARHRTMAFSLQSIQRRISRIIAYLASGVLVYSFGSVLGVKAGVAMSVLLVLLAVFVQMRMLKVDHRDQVKRSAGFSVGLIRRFDPELKKLLAADVLARWAEGMPRELYVLYAVASSVGWPGFGTYDVDARTFGILLALQSLVSMLLYVPIAWLASKPGAEKKPFIGLTFVFFALFPLAFWFLGRELGLIGVLIAYVIAGLREIGEPARKAMITELLPTEAKTAATGLYWSVRSACVMFAPIIGALLWVFVSPESAFIAAGVVGMVGAIGFALMFQRPTAGED